jgi:hypothetical protein
MNQVLFYTNSFILVGMPPPHREWLLVEGDTADDPGKNEIIYIV